MKTTRVPAMFGGAASHGRLLDLIRSTGGLSRQQLIVETGMSRATLYGRLETLLANQLIYEGDSLQATGGRRSREIRFEDRGRVILTFALGHTHATVSVNNTRGHQLRVHTVEHRIGDPAASVLTPLITVGRELLDTGQSETLVGVGVSLPSAVEADTGNVEHSTTLPGWSSDAVVSAMSGAWSVPLVVENDARAAAFGERTTEDETIVYVKVATGIGCGIVINGSILRGSHGAAGDVGHIQISSDGPACSCGRRGCLAAFSSGRALIDELSPLGFTTLREISEASGGENFQVNESLARAADVLGRALATTVTTINPNRLILGGTIGLLPPFAEKVRERVALDVVERIAFDLTIETGAEGDLAASRGLTELVMQKVFAPSAVDELLAG